MIKFFAGILFASILLAGFFFYSIKPFWVTRIANQSDTIVSLTTSIGRAERLLNENSEATADATVDWVNRYNQLCSKWKIRNCMLTSEQHNFRYKFIDREWQLSIDGDVYKPL